MHNDVHAGGPHRAHSRLFQLEGELRADHVDGLRAMALAGDGVGNVLIDCRRVTAYAEGALDALVDLERAVTGRGGKVMLVGIQHPELRHGVMLETPPTAPALRRTA